VFGIAWLAVQRAASVGAQVLRNSWWGLRWLVLENERVPTAYALTERNRRQLAAFVAAIGELPMKAVLECIEELERDKALRDHLRGGPSEAARLANTDSHYGSRAAAYALTRLRRPRTVVETGVSDGLLGCVVAAALERNAAEGHPGFYFGLDPHPGAGRLLEGRYGRYGWIMAGAPLEALKEIEQVDLYLHSRRCSHEQEVREYETLQSRLAEDAIVLSSTANENDALYSFAIGHERSFLYFAEEPHEHWYRGGGLGASYL
jgi:hypothetical protein